MRGRLCALVLLILTFAIPGAHGQERVRFSSLDGKGGEAATPLEGYLFKPARSGPWPSVVFLHGCGGLISTISRKIMSREMDWATRLNAAGYAVLMVDSYATRGSGEMCSTKGFKLSLYLKRPADAYGALAFLGSRL